MKDRIVLSAIEYVVRRLLEGSEIVVHTLFDHTQITRSTYYVLRLYSNEHIHFLWPEWRQISYLQPSRIYWIKPH